MNELTMVRLDAPRLPRGGLRCPVCGRVHGIGRWIFALALLLAAVLSLPVGGPARADTGTARSAGGGHARMESPAEPAEEAAARTGTADIQNSPVEVHPAVPLLNAPDTAVVWNRAGTGVYLWDRPGGAILAFIENGLVVRLTERWEGYGGVPFGEAAYDGGLGWVDMRSVHRVVVPEVGFDRLAAGGYLYDAPGGQVLAWLPAGTPVIVIGESATGWLEVELLVGKARGWITR
jgi:hypothetical protein